MQSSEYTMLLPVSKPLHVTFSCLKCSLLSPSLISLQLIKLPSFSDPGPSIFSLGSLQLHPVLTQMLAVDTGNIFKTCHSVLFFSLCVCDYLCHDFVFPLDHKHYKSRAGVDFVLHCICRGKYAQYIVEKLNLQRYMILE